MSTVLYMQYKDIPSNRCLMSQHETNRPLSAVCPSVFLLTVLECLREKKHGCSLFSVQGSQHPSTVVKNMAPQYHCGGSGSKICFARERKNVFLQIFIFFISKILQNLFYVIFSVTMWEEGRGVRDEAMRGEG